MPRVTVDLENSLYDKFSVLCARLRKKKAVVIRELVEGWVKTNE
jgi:predicted DNA-binding protein